MERFFKNASIGTLLFIILLQHDVNAALAEDCNIDLGSWLECNEPRVVAYLLSLSDADKGKAVDGVIMTDGRAKLRGSVFLEEVHGVRKGAHLYLFQQRGHKVAYVWVGEGGVGVELPTCDGAYSDKPGPAFVLSGDVYTWKAVKPGGDLVLLDCVPDDWLKSIRAELA